MPTADPVTGYSVFTTTGNVRLTGRGSGLPPRRMRYHTIGAVLAGNLKKSGARVPVG